MFRKIIKKDDNLKSQNEQNESSHFLSFLFSLVKNKKMRLNHGKNIPIYVVFISLIVGFFLTKDIFFGAPYATKANEMRFLVNLDKDMEGFVWNLNSCGGSCVQDFVDEKGARGRAVFVSVSGKKSINSGFWSKAISWEEMGIPAGSAVMAVDGRFDFKVARQTFMATEKAALKIFNSSGSDNIIKNNEDLENLEINAEGETSWLTMDIAGEKIVKESYSASDTIVSIALEQTAESGRDNSAVSEIRADNIVLIISYIPPANSIDVETQKIDSSVPFSATALADLAVAESADIILEEKIGAVESSAESPSPDARSSPILTELVADEPSAPAPSASSTESSSSLNSAETPPETKKTATVDASAIEVSSWGIQIASAESPSVNINIGGGFIFARDSGSANVTQIILAESGTIDAKKNISNLVLFYKEQSSCSAIIPLDAVSFNNEPAGFKSSERAVIAGSMPVGKNKVCVYARFDVGSGASNDETIEIEISNPSADIAVSSGIVSSYSSVKISGTTVLESSSIIAGTEKSQISSVATSTAGVYLGGVFTLNLTGAMPIDVIGIILNETGTVNANANLSNLKLFYKSQSACSNSLPADASLFNETPANFDASEQSAVSGDMTVGTNQVCVYVQLDIGNANEGETIDIEISNSSMDIMVLSGDVSPSSVIALDKTTTIHDGAMYFYNSYGLPFFYNAANWRGANFYLEVFIRAVSGTAIARLFDETGGFAVANSTINTTSLFFERLRTDSSLYLMDGHSYRIQFGKSGSDIGEALGAKLVVY